MDKVVCLMSGGIDTSVLMTKLVKEGKFVHGLMFDYGQGNFEATHEMAVGLCEKLDMPMRVIKIPHDWVKSSIMKGQEIKEGITNDNIYKKGVKELSWVPARNNMFLLLAGSYAQSVDALDVYCAFQFDKVEWEAYDKLENKWEFGGADLTPAFIDLVNETAKFNFKGKMKFHAPFVDEKLDCKEIVAIGRKLEVDFDKTYSCRYQPECDECEQCIIRKERLK